MDGSRSRIWLDLDKVSQEAIVEGALSQEPVSGLTHNFYRYPARFSPLFARGAIEALSSTGDVVFDPFMGGGTVMVEAYRAGRIGVGTDISSLAHFISKVKTRPLSPEEGDEVRAWLQSTVQSNLSIRRAAERPTDYIARGYQKHLNTRQTWRLRKLLELFTASVAELPSQKHQAFARCIVLRVGQWALDGRREIPSFSQTRKRLLEVGNEMILDSIGLWRVVASVLGPDGTQLIAPICRHRSAIGIDEEQGFLPAAPKLVVTSPPYPGVYVTYHRWKIRGRLETAAPFWLAASLDGMGQSFYTMGDRRRPERPGLPAYWRQIREAYSSVRRLCSEDTVMVQLVGFSEPDEQLPLYLEAMGAAGYEECFLPDIDSHDGRLYRKVPNRKWYAAYQTTTEDTSREVVLFHRPAKPPIRP